MAKVNVHADDAPAALGPYSQAIKKGEFIFISGQIGISPKTGKLVAGGIKAEAEQTFKNLNAICRAAGETLDSISKITVYLCHMENFSIINEMMEIFFSPPFPARVTIGVAELPKEAQVEIEAII